jgi:3-deoxy-D-arabino-heptulosonate 7-phosphate (DAHP) synthase
VNRSASHRMTAALSAALVTLGVLAAGEALNPSRPEYLADYGSHQTAEVSGPDAHTAGV